MEPDPLLVKQDMLPTSAYTGHRQDNGQVDSKSPFACCLGRLLSQPSAQD